MTDSYDPLPTERRLTLHNVITLTKSVLNKDKNRYYYNNFSKNVRISYLKNHNMVNIYKKHCLNF